jgi:DNA-binding transcriptional regulator YiaG
MGDNPNMPDIAAALKSEVARIARKEIKQQTRGLKKAAGGHRSDIASLKRRVHDLESELRKLSRANARSANAAVSKSTAPNQRFSAKGFASLRRRLGLSAADLALLIEASAQSVYKWEQGKARPRAEHLAAIAGIRGIGKREVARRLQGLR